MKYLIILISLFLIGCKSEINPTSTGDAATENTTGKTYIPLTVNLSSNNLVMIDSKQMASKEKTISDYMYAVMSFVIPDLVAVDPACLTIADVGSGIAESVINDPTRCLKKVEKIKKIGDKRGFLTWEEVSIVEVNNDASGDTSSDTTNDASGDTTSYSITVQKCGIIKQDGNVNEISMGNCPRKNAGFKNDTALHYVSETKLRGLSNGGNYLEYDTSNDTISVIVSNSDGNIDAIIEIDHANVKKYLYRIGNTARQSINGVVSNVPELYGKYPHKVGTALQFKDGSYLKRAYFDDDGNVVKGPNNQTNWLSTSVPELRNFWVTDYNGYEAQYGAGGSPQGPVFNNSLNNCDKSTIDGVNILLCNSGSYKYTDSASDLVLVHSSAGISGGGIKCSTNARIYYYSTSYSGAGNEYLLRLIKSDPILENYETIFYEYDPINGMTRSQIDDFRIHSMTCTDNTVTATTNTRTIIINNADSTPDISYLDIVAEETI